MTIKNVSMVLAEVMKLAKLYEDYQKKIYTIPDNVIGPSWYKYQHNLWFRGHANNAWKLDPQILRSGFSAIAERYGSYKNDYEQTLYKQYRIRSNHFIDKGISKIDNYFFAQHHGLPTRLLDWTTNPLVALFFSVNTELKEDGAFYAMLSRSNFNPVNNEDVLTQDDEIVQEAIGMTFNGKESKNQFEFPLRIIPNTQYGRLLNQSSRFTFHLDHHKRLEELIEHGIYKFIIKAEDKKNIIEELAMLNIKLSTIYPDLDNLIKELKRDLRIDK